MLTVHEVSRLTGVSIRTLQYYDKIGLLHPTEHTVSGYRLYDDTALEKLQQILLFRELEFPLKDIRQIIDSPGFDKGKALEQQIALLMLKKEHIDNLIDLARGLKAMGVKHLMDFEPFDTSKIDEYAARAKASWGTTPEYREYAEKSKGRTAEDNARLSRQMMEIFSEFGSILDENPAGDTAQALVKKLQGFITAHLYTCSDEVLYGLGMMYAGGGDFTAGIDKHAGEGTAEFVYQAIKAYCKK
ncbi:MAG: MerR family transcriptional regulator [Clostridia bacterium]|nr:MerR family transcriptional regulator [Clostridia bacterium]